jgi:outer membrane protein assembly factor BamB
MLHCVDAGTGQALWTVKTDSYVNGAAAVADGRAVFGGCDEHLHVIDLARGTPVAAAAVGGPVPGSPALAEGTAYLGHYNNAFVAVDLAAGTTLWTFHDRELPFLACPAVTPDVVLFGGQDKLLHCVARDTGRQKWAFQTRGEVDSSPVVCGDRAVFGSDDGRLYIVRLADGKQLWSYEVGAAVGASPAVARQASGASVIVIGADDGVVYAFGTRERRP